jgi:hypothetical protein
VPDCAAIAAAARANRRCAACCCSISHSSCWFSALRYLILPNVESYRPEIERELSQSLGLSVAIGRIEASWHGSQSRPDPLRRSHRRCPGATSAGLHARRERPVLVIAGAPATAAAPVAPRRADLHVRRDAAANFYVAGIAIRRQDNDNGFADWVLAQKRIRINGATVVWEDARRNAPALILEDVNLALDNDGRQHRFGLTALPPAELASKLDLRGDFHGRAIETRLLEGTGLRPDRLRRSGRLAHLARLPAGLAAWPRRRARLGGFADGGLQELTADVSLDEVKLRLAKDLPALELDHMSGRIGGQFSAAGVRIDGQRVELLTRRLRHPGSAPVLRIDPTDFHLEWQHPTSDPDSLRGSATAGRLDLGALSAGRLSAARRRFASVARRLRTARPNQRTAASWQGNSEALQPTR